MTGSSSVIDSAEVLASVIELSIGTKIEPKNLRRLIKHKWDTVCLLAHQIHEQECPSLEKFVQEVNERFNALSPDEKRKSWIVGEIMMLRPSMTREEVERLYEKALDRA